MSDSTPRPFASVEAVFDWLSGYINFEKGLKGKSFRLDRMRALAELAQRPHDCAPAVHVAGSKGKGSVTAISAALTDAAGFSTAKYSSPHVHDYRERISLSDRFFPDNVYTDAAEELQQLVYQATMEQAALFNPQYPGGEEPTFFELLTMLFFLCARRAACTAMAVETGMGGRLDATNILLPRVCIITPVELEHTEYLGSSLAQIAGEKAGIIKASTDLVLFEQDNIALRVFRNTALSLEAPLYYLPECMRLHHPSITRNGSRAVLEFSDKQLFPRSLDIEIPLIGEIQLYNSAAAILAFRLGFPQADTSCIEQALSTVHLSARFERIRENPPVIVDGAHTVKSIRLCTNTFRSLYGEGAIALFACAEDKDPRPIAALLCECFSEIIITSPGTFKKSRPEYVYDCFKEIAGNRCRISLLNNTEAACHKTRQLACEKGLPVLVCGSFYLASEAYKFI